MKTRAFTLIELFVVMGIVAVLAALIVPVVGAIKAKGRTTNELSAARQVVHAYLSYANEHDGEVMPGYGNAFPAKDDKGAPLKAPVNARYPWRLAPYLNYDLRVLYGNVGDSRLEADRERNYDSWVYSVSVAPAFGLNMLFIGGDYNTLPPDNTRATTRYGDFCVRRIVQAVRPASLIVFANACFKDGDDRIPGFFRIESPYYMGRRWEKEYKKSAEPEAYGQVDFRHDDRAICAMLDGHVELLDFKQMDDMRRWANLAADNNDESYFLGKSY